MHLRFLFSNRPPCDLTGRTVEPIRYRVWIVEETLGVRFPDASHTAEFTLVKVASCSRCKPDRELTQLRLSFVHHRFQPACVYGLYCSDIRNDQEGEKDANSERRNRIESIARREMRLGNLALTLRISPVALLIPSHGMYLASIGLTLPSIQLSVAYRLLDLFRGALSNLQLRWFPAILRCASPQLFFAWSLKCLKLKTDQMACILEPATS